MDGGAAHVALEPAHERAGARAVHDGRVVPADEVAGLAPVDAEHVLVLSRVREERLDQSRRLGLRHAAAGVCPVCVRVRILEVVQVVRDVQVRAARGLVALHDSVPPERVLFRINVLQELGLWTCLLARVPEAVGADVVVFEQPGFQVPGELVKGRARVREVGVPAMSWRRELVGPQ